MKKRIILSMFISVIFCTFGLSASADSSDEWKEAPIISDVFESAKEQITVEWEGKANLYQVYLDGKAVITTALDNASFTVKEGNHRISVSPIQIESKDVNTSFDFSIMNVEGSIDLAAFGLDPKSIKQGYASKTVSFQYNTNPILNASPEVIAAATDFQDRVVLTISDKYDSDSYRVAIKSGKDVNYVTFVTSYKADNALITKSNTSVSLVLDQAFLKAQGCLIPDLDIKYSFSVKLRKSPNNRVDGKKESDFFIESKESKDFQFTPFAAWKYPPEITYASQTADGQVTLRWEHENNGLACEYEVIKIDKLLAVKKGEQVLGKTKDKEFIVKDLMNGKQSFAIVPVYAGKKGNTSTAVTMEVKNDWVVAPTFTCQPMGNNRVKLSWSAATGVDKYHVTVYAGNGSVLRYVNLDFKKYTEFDVPAKPGAMEYIYTYKNDVSTQNGVKLRFEVYGIRVASNGTEQKSASSTQTISIK